MRTAAYRHGEFRVGLLGDPSRATTGRTRVLVSKVGTGDLAKLKGDRSSPAGHYLPVWHSGTSCAVKGCQWVVDPENCFPPKKRSSQWPPAEVTVSSS
jgi:hypothetical protein